MSGSETVSAQFENAPSSTDFKAVYEQAHPEAVKDVEAAQVQANGLDFANEVGSLAEAQRAVGQEAAAVQNERLAADARKSIELTGKVLNIPNDQIDRERTSAKDVAAKLKPTLNMYTEFPPKS